MCITLCQGYSKGSVERSYVTVGLSCQRTSRTRRKSYAGGEPESDCHEEGRLLLLGGLRGSGSEIWEYTEVSFSDSVFTASYK